MRLGSRLAFDVGKARVGVARCDADAILAVPECTLTLRAAEDFDDSIDRVILPGGEIGRAHV